MLTYRKSNISANYILATKVCCAPKFVHALENDYVLLVHFLPKTGTLYYFFQRGSKIGLNCNKGTLITWKLEGVARRNFGT